MDMSLTKPVSAEQPCGPDPEYDPEYLLLFSRAARLMRWPPNPSASNWPTSKPVGHYRWRRFAKRRKAQNACKCGRVRH